MQLALWIAGIIVVIVLIILVIASRYRVPHANEALVITGSAGSVGGVKVALGSGAFIVPFIQRAMTIPLDAMQIGLQVPGGVSKDNIRVRVDAVAQAKIDGTPEGVRAAAQRFLDSDAETLSVNIRSILEGALRDVLGRMTVEEMLRDREGFATKIKEVSIDTLSESGLRVDTLQINDIVTDPEDFITNLGRPQIAQTLSAAQIAEATAGRQAAEAQATARVAIASANKDAALKEADFKAQTDEAQAMANAVGPKTKAAQDATITQAEQANATQQVELAKLHYDAEVRMKADADLYAAQKAADAALYTAQQKAKADAAVIQQQGEAQAAATKARGFAEADATKAKVQAEGEAQASATQAVGLAEAAAIKAKGEAEAQVKELLAQAYEKYGQQAVIDRILAAMPEMLSAAAKPLGEIDNITVIGAADQASGLPKLATDLVTQVPAIIKAGTGFDIAEWLTTYMDSQVKPALGGEPTTRRSGSRSSKPAVTSGE